MNAKQVDGLSFSNNKPTFFSRVAYKSFLATITRFFSVIVAVTLFMLSYGIIFYLLAPLQSSSFLSFLEVSVLLYLIPSIVILTIVHMSSPALHIRGVSWRYLKVYMSLFVGAGIYLMVLNLWFTNIVVLVAAIIFFLVAVLIFPTVRTPVMGLRASLYTFASAAIILVSTSGSLLEGKALQRLQTSQASLVQVQRTRPSGYVKNKNKIKEDVSKISGS